VAEALELPTYLRVPFVAVEPPEHSCTMALFASLWLVAILAVSSASGVSSATAHTLTAVIGACHSNAQRVLNTLLQYIN
jgi:hypothetical protein